MKQMFQSARTGQSTIVEVPAPALVPGHVLVANAASLVSAGTERIVIEFAEMNLLQKAKARPDLVRQVLDKARRDGLLTTLDAVRSRLDKPISLGYSSAGTVIAVGEGLSDIRVGDRVACSGMDHASHAEILSVPRLLVTPIPDGNVSFEAAAFTTIGAIAMHGIRLAEVNLGETVAVIGLGLIGLLTVQMLKAAGCDVVGIDLDAERCDLAKQCGADATATSASQFEALVSERTRGVGADSVIITAASSSNGPVELAGDIARSRAIVVAVGAIGTHLPRKTYYEKELDFRISRSYGPGRYDAEYEEKGHDYPISYVRWTESRNMQAFLALVAAGRVRVDSLITHRYGIDQATTAYDLITGKLPERFMGVLISYPGNVAISRRQDLPIAVAAMAGKSGAVRVGMLGAGLFATQILLPAMKKVAGVEFAGVCTATGGTGHHVASRFGFRYCATDEAELLADPKVDLMVIATRHGLHAQQVQAALRAGKHVFCEKPLCLDRDQLVSIAHTAAEANGSLLMVGYNRRFAPMAVELKRFFSDGREPIVAHYRVNAGAIPATHWVHDPVHGGGRIIGEVCHFVDFLMFVTGSEPVSVFASALPTTGTPPDNVAVTIRFANGSLGTVNYVSTGDRVFSKERVEVMGRNRVAVLDDFRQLELVRDGRSKSIKSRLRQDKGHQGEWQAFASACKGGVSPIAFRDIVAGTLATFAINDSLRENAPVAVNVDSFLAASL
ncbi:MAG TPA: bi-domain-containing oxidoreductase [Clostridia bacterium]|nr:bi-domain-containing oxidoreductase [Clostridia bacterium]